MIVAVYARQSTDQNGVADDAKSVNRQVNRARAYAVRSGCHDDLVTYRLARRLSE